MSAGAHLPDDVVADLSEALRGRAEVARAFLVEEAGDRPTIVLELDDAPEDLAAYRDLLHRLFADVAAALGERAHAVSFGAGPPEAIEGSTRDSRVVYEREPAA